MNLRATSLLLALALAAPAATAATFYVTTTGDGGNGSLRAAIDAANAAPNGVHTVLFDLPPDRTITLQSALPVISARSLILDGAAADNLRISAPASALLLVGESNRLLVLQHLRLGPSSSQGPGGCVAALPSEGNANIIVTDVGFSGCRARPAQLGFGIAEAAYGGAILSIGRGLQVTRGDFQNNLASPQSGNGAAYGGAIAALGDASHIVAIVDSKFVENLAYGVASPGDDAAAGGAIVANGVSLRVSGSEFLENAASGNGNGLGRGGHIYTAGSTRLDDNVFWEGGSDFGGIVAEAAESGSSIWLRNNSLYGVASSEGPAVYSNFPQVEVRSNSFLATESDGTRAIDMVVDSPPGGSGLLQLSNNAFQARNVGSIRPGCAVGAGVQVQSAWNLSDRQNTGCGIAAVPAGSLLLQRPEHLGGPAEVIAPLPGSTAIDAGNPAAADASSWDRCMFADARGVRRPQDGDGDGSAICDVGAVEFTPNALFADGFEA